MTRQLNRAAGLLVTLLLLWVLYHQLDGHLARTDGKPWYYIRYTPFLWAAFALLPLNIGIEAYKWRMLLRSTGPLSFGAALKSVLGGLAFSVLTPNRLGDYPGRIMMLDRKTSPRVVSIAVLAAVSQFLTVMIVGVVSLAYAQTVLQGWWITAALCVTAVAAVATGVFYFSFERWAPRIARLPFLKKWTRIGTVLQQYSTEQLIKILVLAVLRFAVYTTQYYLALRSVGLSYPGGGALLLCGLFFFILAMVPSIVLAEAGIRGEVSLFIFGAFVPSKVSLLVVTLGIWLVNLMIPALAGGLLFLKKRWRR